VVLSDGLVLRAAGDVDRKFARHCADLRGRITPAQIGLNSDVPSHGSHSARPPTRTACPLLTHARCTVCVCATGLAALCVSVCATGLQVAKRCSVRAFDAAAELLNELPTLRGPQPKLRAMLRAWDCVLGVLGLCTDSPSADDFLPGMAVALLQASPYAAAHSPHRTHRTTVPPLPPAI
jgi:hypothetical protein